jgi:MFS family permease
VPEVSSDNDAVARSRLAGLRDTLSDRDFRGWFGAQVISVAGTMAQGIGLSWLILQITHSAFALSGMTVALFGPVLLGGAIAGTLLDQVDWRHALLATQAAFTVISAGLAVAAATGTPSLWLLYLMALLTGLVNAFDGPARQLYIVKLASRGRAGSAMGLNEAVLNASRVIGPAVGGVFLAMWGPVPCFAFNAASCLPGIAVLLGHLRRGGLPQQDGARIAERGTARAGLRYVWRQSEIRAALLIAVALGMLLNLGVTVPPLATRTFHLGGGGYGAVNAMFGLGALVGALAAAYHAADPTGRMVRVLAVGTGAAVLLTAAMPTAPLLMAAMAVTGFAAAWLVTLANTLVQLRSHPGARGRVMGVWNMALPGMNPVTAPAIGAVGDAVGPREAFGLAGACLLVVIAVSWTALSGRAQ